MEKQTKNENKKYEEKIAQASGKCSDPKCPFHGQLSVRGRTFQGTVIKKFPKRAVISFERTVYIPKFERYAKSRTKLHARLPDCLAENINLGDYIEITECRPLSKIISFVVMKKIRDADAKNKLDEEIK